MSKKQLKIEIRAGWWEAGKRGARLGPDVYVSGQLWTPVLWDGEEDPTFHKTAGIRELSRRQVIS